MNLNSVNGNNVNGINGVTIKKEISDVPEISDISMMDVTSTPAISNDIYNLYIKSDLTTSQSSVSASANENKSSIKTKEIGIVFMVLIFSFSLFTFPLSIFSARNSNEFSGSLISSFMNKLSDFSLASISSDNAGKILSSGYEQEKPFLLDSGHYELAGVESQRHGGELEVRSIDRRSKRDGRNSSRSRKVKSSQTRDKSKSKRNTTRRNIKKNYEYTSFNEISSLMNIFHPKNVDLDEESLKQMSLLQHWIVEGFCNVHENHTFAKESSNIKDLSKIYKNDNEEGSKNEGSTDLTVKKNGNDYYDTSKSFTKEIPWNMKQFIKFYPDTTYFYSPKLVQLFPISSSDILDPSVPLINRLQPNDTVEAEESKGKDTNVSQSSSRYTSSSAIGGHDNEEMVEEEGRRGHRQSSSKSESHNGENVYHLPFSKNPKMAIIANIESENIDEESNSYLMIDFEIKGARLIENE